jgi:putative N6-adenine-specific DNA methylase
MTSASETFEIYLVATPGLEAILLKEVQQLAFPAPRLVTGGVVFEGTWNDVMRANLQIRGAGRVLARIGSFHAVHLAQLDKQARKFPWYKVLRKDVPVRVEATCRKSKIYHAGAAIQRVATAITEELGAPISDDADITIKLRIENNLCTLSIDTSGEKLHKRGHKEATAKAPIRETIAALLLRACGFDGREPVLDPMCGSGTFIIEAAEIAMGLQPGRGRDFAFEKLKTFDAAAWKSMREGASCKIDSVHFFGSDRDAGAIRSATANAERAGVLTVSQFSRRTVSELQRPDGAGGLVILNPPYGARIGDKRPLHDLHASLGAVLKEHFYGWRVGLVTADKQLARSTGLPFKTPLGPINHGGLKVFLFQTEALKPGSPHP